MPTNGQVLLVILAALIFAVGGLCSLVRLWRPENSTLAAIANLCAYLGVAAAVASLIWHTADQHWMQPLSDNFDALLWLAVLLAMFVLYIQTFRPLAGLDWFIMPVVMLLLIGAAIVGEVDPKTYSTIGKDTFLWVHTFTAYAGAAAFAIAAAGGAAYVLAARSLRRKKGLPPIMFGSLERQEHVMMTAVTLGFALLTIAAITGLVRIFERADQKPVAHAKILLAMLSWLVYAIVMHAPFNPRFRGRRAAMLSVFGFALMVGTVIAVQFMPGGKT